MNDRALEALRQHNPRAWLGEVEVFEAEVGYEDGSFVCTSGARLPDRERFRPARAQAPGQREPLLGAALEDWLDQAAPDDTTEAWIRLRREVVAPGDDVVTALSLAMVTGELETEADARRVRAEAIAHRREVGERALIPWLHRVEADGGEVIEVDPASGQLLAVLSPAALERYAVHPQVGALHLGGHHPAPDTTDCTVTDGAGCWLSIPGDRISGVELEDLIQTPVFYDDGYYGEEALGLVEAGGSIVFNPHPGFHDGDGLNRWENCTWSWSGCEDIDLTEDENAEKADAHATAVASVMVGDITRSQDPEVSFLFFSDPVNLLRRQRSGVARRASGLSLSPVTTGWVHNTLTDSERDIHVVNNSWSNGDLFGLTDKKCEGTSTWSKAYNTMYEEGIAHIKSAGNEDNYAPLDCTVTDPGSAMGVFTVGAYIVQNNQEVIEPLSSRGGTATEGRGRTIVDIWAPTQHEFPYPWMAWPVDEDGDEIHYGLQWPSQPGTDPIGLGGTSGAAPVVTGFAGVFRHWYLSEKSTLINDPGILYANLLLMGDRSTPSDARRVYGYDSLTGAGKLRGRRFDATGLDGPYYWGTGRTCVADGETVPVYMAMPLSSDVETLKVVTWWYDPRHDTGTDHNKLTLKAQSRYVGGVWEDELTDSSNDNKQRVYIRDPQGGLYWRMQITGRDVTGDSDYCGEGGGQLVHYAYLLEDQDREDAEELGTVRREWE